MSSLSQNIVGTTARILEDPTGPPRPSCKYPLGFQGACMHACMQAPTPDCRNSKLTHSPAYNLMHVLRRHHHAPSRLRRTHSLLSPQLPTTSLRHFSRLCIISRQAFLATSFTLLSRSTAARCSSFPHPALHLTTDAISCNTKSTFLRHRRLGFLKRKMAVATPRVLG